MSKTADELIKELSKDEIYQSKKIKREKKIQSLEKKLKADEKPLIEALSKIGIDVKSVWDLVNLNKPYEGAIPILIKHLEEAHHPKTLAGIARALAVIETNKFEKAWNILLNMYKNTKSDKLINVPELRGLKQGLSVALSFLCNRERLKDILPLIKEKKHGDSRVILIDGLSRFKDDIEVKNTLKSLLNDKELGYIAKKYILT